MCDECGCGDPEKVSVDVHEHLLAGNAATAAHNRDHFRAHGLLTLNLMGSPGAGKTALLEATARARHGLRIAAVSGDLATENDANRLLGAGIPAKAITTGSACHLDAKLVHESLGRFPEVWDADVFVIENVGNLVCPAVYDLGQEANVVALSVTEGDDKPLKYPLIFQKADLVLLTKIDLLPHLDFSLDKVKDALQRVNPEPRVIALSARTGEGVEQWTEWVEARLARLRRQYAGEAHGHAHAHGHSHGEGHEHGHEHAHGHSHR